MFFGEEEHTENRVPRAQCCSVGAHRNFLKRGAEVRLKTMQGPCACMRVHMSAVALPTKNSVIRVMFKGLWDSTQQGWYAGNSTE